MSMQTWYDTDKACSMGCNPTWNYWMYSPNPDPAAVVCDLSYGRWAREPLMPGRLGACRRIPLSDS